ncbi:hypothetical protein [Bacillus solitudinis]|uniref:hypothetical protein n=1 Tax=Bacillus solitudinis TaxID=2014074 RepID=UPI000C242B87|nr:hypothetical protein [Bacillus solitudinis]
MRLTKTLYFIEEEKTITGYSSIGQPQYETVTTFVPFKGEVEPYSAKLAETNYGLFVEVTNRFFCKPNSNITFHKCIRYDEENYYVTEYLKYDKHFEVLMQKGEPSIE